MAQKPGRTKQTWLPSNLSSEEDALAKSVAISGGRFVQNFYHKLEIRAIEDLRKMYADDAALVWNGTPVTKEQFLQSLPALPRCTFYRRALDIQPCVDDRHALIVVFGDVTYKTDEGRIIAKRSYHHTLVIFFRDEVRDDTFRKLKDPVVIAETFRWITKVS